MPSESLPLGVVLAGGASRRFGSAKAHATVAGRRIVDRIRDALAPVVGGVVSAGGPAADGLETIADPAPGMGPLGGVIAGLVRARLEGRPGILAVACDLPFVTTPLLRLLAERGAGAASVVAPASGGRRGWEPLCAWYPVSALPELRRMAAEGELALHRLVGRVPVSIVPLRDVWAVGDPGRFFLNVNDPSELAEAERVAATPPVVTVIGRKNSGKTTLVVALLAELRRRGRRVASMKHGHHAFETDTPGTDSWRHFHDGGADATLMVGAGRVALSMRVEGEPDPAALVRAFHAGRGLDLVVAEGWKRGPFPRLEVFRRGQHAHPLASSRNDDDPVPWLALVTDAPEGVPGIPTVALRPDGGHVALVADLVERRLPPVGGPDGG